MGPRDPRNRRTTHRYAGLATPSRDKAARFTRHLRPTIRGLSRRYGPLLAEARGFGCRSTSVAFSLLRTTSMSSGRCGAVVSPRQARALPRKPVGDAGVSGVLDPKSKQKYACARTRSGLSRRPQGLHLIAPSTPVSTRARASRSRGRRHSARLHLVDGGVLLDNSSDTATYRKPAPWIPLGLGGSLSPTSASTPLAGSTRLRHRVRDSRLRLSAHILRENGVEVHRPCSSGRLPVVSVLLGSPSYYAGHCIRAK